MGLKCGLDAVSIFGRSGNPGLDFQLIKNICSSLVVCRMAQIINATELQCFDTDVSRFINRTSELATTKKSNVTVSMLPCSQATREHVAMLMSCG